MMKQRNAMLDITKFIFSVAVLLLHANPIVEGHELFTMRKGYLAVEFFFIVSGYFMMRSINWKKLGGGDWLRMKHYTLSRIKCGDYSRFIF